VIAIDPTPSGQIRVASAGAGRRVDIEGAVAGALGALAVVGWAVTGIVHIAHRSDENDAWVTLTAVAAATVTVSAVVCAVGASNRKFVRTLVDEDLAVLCRRIDKLARAAKPANGSGDRESAADVEWRAYLAGHLDRDDRT
jgi:uncharacterized membrane protein YcjF (UPF0283 family)